MNLEELFTSRTGFNVTTASPTQRAWCRIIGGQPLGVLADHPEVIASVGGPEAVAALPVGRPDRVVVLSAVRCGKTQLAVANAICASQTVDVSKLSAGEVPRYSIVSLTKDHARAALGMLVGAVQASPVLRRLQVGKPTAEGITLRQHTTGWPMEIVAPALAEAGGSVVSRWSFGLVIDEYPRAPYDGVVRIQDLFTAVLGRLLPGASVLAIGSPWAPSGPAYNDFVSGWGHPTQQLVVLRGVGPQLNPIWWTEERCEKLKKADPIAYRCDVLGEFVDGESGVLDVAMVERMKRTAPPPTSSPSAVAAGDLGTRSNGSTLAIGWCERRDNKPHVVIGYVKEWRGTSDAPLALGSMFVEWATILSRFGVRRVHVDQWSFDAAREIAKTRGVELVEMTSADRGDMYQSLEVHGRENAIEVPDDPQLARDLLAIRKKAIPTGYRIELPRTPDGRHADFAPSVALCTLLASRTRPPLNFWEQREANRQLAELGRAIGSGGFGAPRQIDEMDDELAGILASHQT